MNKSTFKHSGVHIMCGAGFAQGRFMLALGILQLYVHRCTLCVCIELMEWLEVWQCSGTTSNDSWIGGGQASAPAIITVWIHYMVGVAAKLWGPWVCSWERQCSRTGKGVQPHQPRAVSHAPASSLSTQFKKQSWADHHVPQKAVSIGLSEHFPRSFISLCLLVSNEEAERRESQQTPSCWDFFIFSSGF